MTFVAIPYNATAATTAKSAAKEEAVTRLSSFRRLLPILFFMLYLNVTVFLFAFGPWPWPVRDGTKLYTFLAFAHLALLTGYLSVSFRSTKSQYIYWTPKQIIQFCLFINLLLLAPTVIARVRSGIPDIVGGVTDPGAAYVAAIEQRSSGVISLLVEYMRILCGPALYMLLPLTIYYWSQLRFVVKGLAVFSFLGVIGTFIAMGTNKAIADMIVVTPWMILAGYYAGYLQLTKRHKLTMAVGAILAFLLFFAFFSLGQLTRPGSGAESGYFLRADIYADRSNFLVRRLPFDVQSGAMALASYVTQGYYALYLSLDKPFVPMFGVGNSMFLYRNLARITGNDRILEMPYPVRIERENGWDAYGTWSSIYPWIASDVSFPGTIVVVFLIGRLFALSWLETLEGQNPFAVAAFSQFLIMIYYFSANNQIMQNGETLSGFLGIMILWLYTRKDRARLRRTFARYHEEG